MKRAREEISKEMSLIRSKDTKPELKLRKALFKRGLRYRVNCSKVLGHPDILFTKYKIAVFVDGDFWHGHHFEEQKEQIKTHKQYWIPKIETNMKRDVIVTHKLEEQGYQVIRIWEDEINRDINRVSDIVYEAYMKAKNPYSD